MGVLKAFLRESDKTLLSEDTPYTAKEMNFRKDATVDVKLSVYISKILDKNLGNNLLLNRALSETELFSYSQCIKFKKNLGDHGS